MQVQSFIKWRLISLMAMLLILSGTYTSAQNPGMWIMYFGNTSIKNTPLFVHSEMQIRNKNLMNKSEQILLRAGLLYQLKDNFSTGLGAGYFMNYENSEIFTSPDSKEFRTWQQLINKSKIQRVNLEHRYRLEQRWRDADYTNRMRYRLQVNIPFNKSKIEKGAYLLNVYNEVFLEFDDTPYDRNRFYTAIGYQLLKSSQIQIGYLKQNVNQQNLHYLQFGFYMNH
jgi:hypothetical protein